MSTVTPMPSRGLWHRVQLALIRRRLDRYPSTAPRYAYLGIVVLIAISLYYIYWEEGATLPLLLPYYHMSFHYFLVLVTISNAIGAFAAGAAGLSDKVGRVNMALFGTLSIGLLQLVAIPNISSKLGFAFAYSAIGIVEGLVLVVTPALMRDFSPQIGRASAMGFWTLGPVLGFLAASLVATHTLPHLHPWQDQFVISGITAIVIFAIGFFGLRELSPQLRAQLMVTERERALVEARARGIDFEATIRKPLQSVLHLDLILSSIGISVFLLIYYAAVTIFTIYWVLVFGQTTANANGIKVWFAACNAGAVVVTGIISDALHVRKPFMLIGTAGAIAMTIILLSRTSFPHTGYYTHVIIVSLLGASIGIAYTPWLAAFTERIEDRHPALVATGLGLWGWILRMVVAVSFLVIPYVITTATIAVDNQAAATSLQALQAAQPYFPTATKPLPPPMPATVRAGLEAVGSPGRAAVVFLRDYPANYAATHNFALAQVRTALEHPSLTGQLTALQSFVPLAARIRAGQHVSPAAIAGVGRSSPVLATLLRAEAQLVPAQKAAPDEWRRWWWVCVAGQIIFLLLIFAMRGRWSPRAARRDLTEHERMVEIELAKLRQEGTLLEQAS